MSTKYRVVFQISNRIKEIEIEAASPMLAFRKFKELMPKIMFDNLSVNEIKVDIPDKFYTNKREKVCMPCNPIFNDILKQAI
jgi:nicotinate-nucleotide pyrophosphorylase